VVKRQDFKSFAIAMMINGKKGKKYQVTDRLATGGPVPLFSPRFPATFLSVISAFYYLQ